MIAYTGNSNWYTITNFGFDDCTASTCLNYTRICCYNFNITHIAWTQRRRSTHTFLSRINLTNGVSLTHGLTLTASVYTFSRQHGIECISITNISRIGNFAATEARLRRWNDGSWGTHGDRVCFAVLITGLIDVTLHSTIAHHLRATGCARLHYNLLIHTRLTICCITNSTSTLFSGDVYCKFCAHGSYHTATASVALIRNFSLSTFAQLAQNLSVILTHKNGRVTASSTDLTYKALDLITCATHTLNHAISGITACGTATNTRQYFGACLGTEIVGKKLDISIISAKAINFIAYVRNQRAGFAL